MLVYIKIIQVPREKKYGYFYQKSSIMPGMLLSACLQEGGLLKTSDLGKKPIKL